MPKFAIIIPAYNAEKYLKEALDSVINQTYSNFEVIVINDASTDEGLAIIRGCEAKDSRIKLIDLKENRGSGYGRNLALSMTRAKYIVFLDADDFLEKNALELANKAIEKKSKVDVLVWGFNKCDKRGVSRSKFVPSKPNKKNGETPFRLGMLNRKGFYAYPWLYVVKKEIIDNYNLKFTVGIFFQDIQFTSQLLYHTDKIKIIPKVCVNYRKHENSVTGFSSKEKIFQKFFAFEKIKFFLQENRCFVQYEKLYNIRLLTFCIYTCYNEYLLLPRSKVDGELRKFMQDYLKTNILDNLNILLLKELGYGLPVEEKHIKTNFIRAYRGLRSIKSNYRWYAFKTRLTQKLYRAIKGFN